MKRFPPLLYVLLAPTFLEWINIKQYTIQLSFMPVSLGLLTFTLLGITALALRGIRQSSVFTALILIFSGAFVGAFFSDAVFSNISNCIAQLILTFAALGFSTLFFDRNELIYKIMDLFFAVLFIYWLQYVLEKTLLGGELISYTDLSFSSTGSKAYNHHIPGYNLTLSASYLAGRLFENAGIRRTFAYIILGITILCCVLLESRSNLLVIIFSSMWLVLQARRKTIGFIILLCLSILAVYLLVEKFLESYAFLNTRFDLQNTGYQRETNLSRVFLYENFLTSIAENPLGRGLLNARILYEYKLTNLHNQYLTYILAGGIVAAIGVFRILLIFSSLIHFNKFEMLSGTTLSYTRGFTMLLVTLFLTLFTIESSGVSMFICFGMLIFLEKQFNALKYLQRKHAAFAIS